MTTSQEAAARLSMLSGILCVAAMIHRRWTRVGQLGTVVVLGLMAWLLLAGLERPSEGRIASSMATACAVTFAVAGVLVPLRLLASANVWLLSLTMVGSWFILETSLSTRNRILDAPLEWSMGNAILDPVKGTIYRAHTSFKCYYDSNPRGTFSVDPTLGPLDQRLWMWEKLGDVEATFLAAKGWESPFVLEMTKPQPFFPKAYSIAQVAWVKPGLPYRLDISWRSNRGMSPTLEISDESRDTVILEKKLNETGDLNPVESISFETPPSCSKMKVSLSTGTETGRLELMPVSLHPKIESGSQASEEDYHLPPRYSKIHRMNAEGFRDKDHERKAKPGVYRIAFVGDSVTLGQGVEEQQRFSNVVEQLWRSSLRPRSPVIETLNFGICGHCTEQEVVTYEHFVRPYEPNMVFLTMIPNDAMPYEEEMEFHRRNEELRRAWEEKSAILGRLSQWNAPLPDYSRSMNALRDLVARCKRDDAQLVVCLFRNHTGREWDALLESVEPIAAELGVPLLDLGSKMTLERVVQTVHRTDGHPNEIAHRMAAEMIVESIGPTIEAHRR